ncbi:hypothetical protein [Cohnella sp. AR92]|uniref:hypothetical protein n=1 Tax=Cohnella sp. AR92 TaxID=648716 RepID=UPI000F8EFB06|nr:hypothetical protein [Cohnella sp. AR92]RUS45695.1 hypothetical protein ELR57_17670 [Cohnella sp. AR92]
MYTQQVGSFVLNLEIAVYLIAGLAGVLGIRLRMRRHPEKARMSAYAGNAVLLWLLVWKGSLLLFHPVDVISNPWSLVYFSGGANGIWLATVVSASYLIYRSMKTEFDVKAAGSLLTVMILGWTAIYYSAQAILLDDSVVRHSLMAIGAAALYMVMAIGSPADGQLSTVWLWLGLGKAALAFMEPDREPLILEFSAEQLAWLLFAGAMLVVVTRSERGKRFRERAGGKA